MTKIGQLRTDKSIDSAMREIREWLDRIKISGFSIDLRYDPKQNVALCRFTYQGKNYEFTSRKQTNCRLNMHAIARVMESKVRAHLMDIERFDTAMSPYLRLNAPQGTFHQATIKSEERNYMVLGLS